jgi:hypothetical protein
LALGFAFLPMIICSQDLEIDLKILKLFICDVQQSLYSWEDVHNPRDYGFDPEYVKGRIDAYDDLLRRFEEIYRETSQN